MAQPSRVVRRAVRARLCLRRQLPSSAADSGSISISRQLSVCRSSASHAGAAAALAPPTCNARGGARSIAPCARGQGPDTPRAEEAEAGGGGGGTRVRLQASCGFRAGEPRLEGARTRAARRLPRLLSGLGCALGCRGTPCAIQTATRGGAARWPPLRARSHFPHGGAARESEDGMRHAHQPTPSLLRLAAHPLDEAQRGAGGEAAPQGALRPPPRVVGLVWRHEDQLRPLADVVAELHQDGDHLHTGGGSLGARAS